MAPSLRKQALKIIEKSEDGIIEPSDLTYSIAPVMVRKSDGTYRMCIDYRDVDMHVQLKTRTQPQTRTLYLTDFVAHLIYRNST